VAIVDVTPAADTGFAVADGLRALPAPPIVILTSSTDRTQFAARLNGLRFIAKADICAAAIARLARAPIQADRTVPPHAPSQRNERPALTPTITMRPAIPTRPANEDDHHRGS